MMGSSLIYIIESKVVSADLCTEVRNQAKTVKPVSSGKRGPGDNGAGANIRLHNGFASLG